MAYEVVANTMTPALVIYLIDISGSMKDKLDGASKISHVNEAIEHVLAQMVERSTKGAVIAPRYRLSMVAYSDTPFDLLGDIHTIDKVAQKGTPQLSATHSTDTAAAFIWARDLLKKELPTLGGKPAPMICHLTDGHFTGNDPEPIAREIMQMSNDDGHVLIENIYVGPNLTRQPINDPQSWPGIIDESELTDKYAKKLFNMSSSLPDSYAHMLMEEGYNLVPGCRMLIPGTNKDLIKLAFAMSGATPTVEMK
jgi:hypothetical protein